MQQQGLTVLKDRMYLETQGIHEKREDSIEDQQ
jgi:hypothetical protein